MPADERCFVLDEMLGHASISFVNRAEKIVD
jgi:hypothetical protein